MEKLERNKDVILNFGFIAVGPLREIEKLQQLVIEDCRGLKIVYQTVSAKRLKLVKVSSTPNPNSPFFGIRTTFTGGSQNGRKKVSERKVTGNGR
jgi:hypothetical protein